MEMETTRDIIIDIVEGENIYLSIVVSRNYRESNSRPRFLLLASLVRSVSLVSFLFFSWVS